MKQTNQLMKRLTAICLAVITMIGVSTFTYAAELRYGKVTGNGVNLRSAPTTASYVLTNLPENTSVAVIGEEENGWYRVSYENKIGYMAAEYVAPEVCEEGEEPQQINGYVTGSSVFVRSEPNTHCEVITALTKYTSVVILDEVDGWYLIETDSVKGYMNASYVSISPAAFTDGDKIVEIAKRYLGYRYVYGGTNPSTGFDCSGLVTWVYKQYNGYQFQCRTALYRDGARVNNYGDLQAGDLVFFRTAGNGSISHVGIYVGDGQFIHAPNPRSVVKISSMAPGSYYYSTYCGARRIF